MPQTTIERPQAPQRTPPQKPPRKSPILLILLAVVAVIAVAVVLFFVLGPKSEQQTIETPIPEPTPIHTTEPSLEPTPTTEPTPEPIPEDEPPTPEPTPEVAAVEIVSTPEPTPEPSAEPTPNDPTPTPTPIPSTEPTATPTPSATPTPTPTPTQTATPAPTPTPEAQTEEPKKDTSTANRTIGVLLEGNNSVVTELASEDSQVSKNDMVLAGYVGSPAQKVMLGFEQDTNFFFASLLQGLGSEGTSQTVLRTMLTAYISEADADKIASILKSYLDEVQTVKAKYKDSIEDGMWVGTEADYTKYLDEVAPVTDKYKITREHKSEPRIYQKINGIEVALIFNGNIFTVVIK